MTTCRARSASPTAREDRSPERRFPCRAATFDTLVRESMYTLNQGEAETALLALLHRSRFAHVGATDVSLPDVKHGVYCTVLPRQK